MQFDCPRIVRYWPYYTPAPLFDKQQKQNLISMAGKKGIH